MRSLPRIVSQIPNDLRNFLDRVREYMSEGGEDRFVTLRELRSGGIVGTTPAGTITEPVIYGVEDPKAPTGLITTGALASVIIEWDEPNYLGHSYAEIWAATTNDFTLKELVGTVEGTIFSHNIGSGATRYYWVRFVNKLNTFGPFNDLVGTVGVTGQNPDYLIDVLSDAYGVTGPAPFFQINSPTVINGVTIPAGTYIKQAWIADATISRAKIQDLAVDNAKISDLSAAKVTAGTLQVGSYIQSQSYVAGTSGWKINSNGDAEFAQISARGSLYGGGATGYATGAVQGFFSGVDSSVYKWRVGDPTGARIQWTGTAVEVYNSSNVLTLSSGGVSVSYDDITGTKPPIDATRNVVYRQTTAPTSGMSVNDIWFNTTTNITYYYNGTAWVITNANTITGQGAFATLSQITSANVSTYIASAAIGNAQIGTAAITNAKIGNLEVDNAKIANLTLSTGKIVNNAVSELVSTNTISGYPTIFSTAGTIYTFPSFTSPAAGLLVITITSVFHNFSTATSVEVQAMNYVNNSSGIVDPPIHFLSASNTNASFTPIGPTPTTSGSSATYTSQEVLSVTAGQSITIELDLMPGVTNTSVYLLDSYYTAILYKK